MDEISITLFETQSHRVTEASVPWPNAQYLLAYLPTCLLAHPLRSGDPQFFLLLLNRSIHLLD